MMKLSHYIISNKKEKLIPSKTNIWVQQNYNYNLFLSKLKNEM